MQLVTYHAGETLISNETGRIFDLKFEKKNKQKNNIYRRYLFDLSFTET